MTTESCDPGWATPSAPSEDPGVGDPLPYEPTGPSDPVGALLAERERTHGEFKDHAECTQAMKDVMAAYPNWAMLNDCQREALHMIVHKVGRIMAGNVHHQDHWDDIAGYATLGSRACIKVNHL